MQDPPCIQIVSQHLKHRSRNWVALSYLPEAGRTAPVKLVVPMVIRPDPIPRRLQDLSAQNVKPESDQYIKFLPPYTVKGIAGETMHKPPGYRRNPHPLRILQIWAAIRLAERMIGARDLSAIPSRIKPEKQSAPLALIPQGICRFARQGLLRLSLRVINHQLQPSEVALRDMLQHLGNPCRLDVVIQQHPNAKGRTPRSRVAVDGWVHLPSPPVRILYPCRSQHARRPRSSMGRNFMPSPALESSGCVPRPPSPQRSRQTPDPSRE